MLAIVRVVIGYFIMVIGYWLLSVSFNKRNNSINIIDIKNINRTKRYSK